MAAVTHFELLFGCGSGSGACACSDSDSCSIVVPLFVPLLFHCCSILVPFLFAVLPLLRKLVPGGDGSRLIER